jgi:hypothetical protein
MTVKMQGKVSLVTGLIMAVTIYSHGQINPVERGLEAITADAIKAQLGFLSSDWTEGRMAGEKGEFLAADYIASMLQLYGVKPAGDFERIKAKSKKAPNNERSYFQNFTLIKTRAGEEPVLKIRSAEGNTLKTTTLSYNVDFTIRLFAPTSEIEAPVVFAGYGIINNKLKYNDFSNIDVKGKLVLKIGGVPKFMKESPDYQNYLSATADIESNLKAMGAAGIIEFNPDIRTAGEPEKRDFLNMSPAEENPRSILSQSSYTLPGTTYPDRLIRIEVSAKVANEILKGSGISLADYMKSADKNEPFNIPPLKGKTISLKTTVISSQVAVRNIIGQIEGNNPDEVIVLGAHYDHLGRNNGYIWNGADDNGSGTVGIMTIAKAIMSTGKKPEKTIIIALWTAEEEGLLGSRYWVENPSCPLKNIKLNLNMDMISRYISDNEPRKATMTYSISNPGFRELTVNNLRKSGIDLAVDYQPSADPPGGSDHRSFAAAGIPIMRFKPGHREEYHTPFDETGTIDWDIMEKIIKISYLNVWELANTNW